MLESFVVVRVGQDTRPHIIRDVVACRMFGIPQPEGVVLSKGEYFVWGLIAGIV
jgi:hypothetical protein